ncbi:signal recognition particle subunit SRP68 [Trypanosoma conorhini]|uniref:Signal recognition particle subunit SRP68 n=1 Tax=Trypanosoma conorhini TaxID=83891 RepID=A0A3R7MW56_9TRYP|nr:signal recognition particle subunit SRP68 [Trypanosoma conorhini]RNF12236.1 signal recognition particle subunit SRP68 [Trypanosoma conorhini]
MEFDLLLFLKEIQLQHGLRAEDYARYRRYTTNRLSTLRHQLGLVHDSKKFQQKEITPQNATRPEHLQLLLLCAERCWAAAEEMQEKRHDVARIGENKPPGGLPPSDQFRKRLNKSVKWAWKLHEVAQAVASPRLKQEAKAYALEIKGRAAAAHGAMEDAKKYFSSAREEYYALRKCSTPEQWMLLLTKANEMDDRVVYCMLRLGEDTSNYRPHLDREDTTEQLSATTIEWNGRQLNVASIKVRDALREVRTLNVEALKTKVLELGGPVPVGQQNKVLDLMDRRIGCLNDALAHARQDLRTLSDDRQKTELQLLVHYLLFQASYETLQRTLFMVDVYVRRFCATEKSLSGGGSSGSISSAGGKNKVNTNLVGVGGKSKKDIPPSQYASPLEIVRLYDAALETLGEMELLPGVAGRAEVEEFTALCHAGKLLYMGEGWRISRDSQRAQVCYKASLATLDETPSTPRVETLRLVVERLSLQLASSSLLTTVTSGVVAGKAGEGREEDEAKERTTQYLVDAGDQVTVAQNIIKFPPDYQTVPCKPVFVDIALTYVDYPTQEAASRTKPQEEQQTSDSGSRKEERRWKWGWGWRK